MPEGRSARISATRAAKFRLTNDDHRFTPPSPKRPPGDRRRASCAGQARAPAARRLRRVCEMIGYDLFNSMRQSTRCRAIRRDLVFAPLHRSPIFATPLVSAQHLPVARRRPRIRSSNWTCCLLPVATCGSRTARPRLAGGAAVRTAHWSKPDFPKVRDVVFWPPLKVRNVVFWPSRGGGAR